MSSAFSATLAYTWARPGASAIVECPTGHAPHVPRFTPTSSLPYLSPEAVRAGWPCFVGTCTLCHQRVQIWASFEHFLAGGWAQAPP